MARLVLGMGLVLAVTTPAPSATWIVDGSGDGDAATIQGAIDLASPGDTVLVRAGTYDDVRFVITDFGTRLANVSMKDGVHVRSESGPVETVIEGRGIAQYGVWFPQEVTEAGVIEGFTFRGMLVGCYVYFSSPVIRGNLFLNQPLEAVQMWNATPYILSNTIYRPQSFGIRAQLESRPVIIANIVAEGDNVGIFCGNDGPTIVCNDVWGNAVDYDGPCAVGITNISADPEFCDPGAGDFRLSASSPCLPENSPLTCDLIGAFGPGCDVVSVGGGAAASPAALWVVPNPARGPVTFGFDLQGDREGRLAMFDVTGRMVWRDALQVPAGAIEWTGPARGASLSPGVYFVRLEWRTGAITRRLVVLP